MALGRDLVVRIRADVTDFQNKMKLAQGQVAAFDKNLQKNTTKSGKALNALGISYRGVGVAAGGIAAAGVASMVRSSADFEQGLANVTATGAVTRGELAKLREQALKFGMTTTYSATEATGGMEALLKAGVSASDVIGGGLKGALDLAAAGELEVGTAAESAASAMTQFGLSGKDVPHIADLLAAGAGKAQGEVADMAAALNQAGLVANGFGLSIEETTGVLAEFASAGLVGSDAGTSLRTLLIRMAAPTDTAKTAMQKYGIVTRNANGELKNASQIAGELQRAFKGKSDAERDAALATIFGQDAIRGANVLYKDGAEKSKGWVKAVDDTGFAAKSAKDRTNTLRGDLDKLKNSWDTFGAGAGGSGGFRPMIQQLDAVIDKMAEVDRKYHVIDAAVNGLNDKPKGETFSLGGALADLVQAGGVFASGTEVPWTVRVKLAGTGRNAAEAAKIAKQAGLTDKQVKVSLKLIGWNARQIKAVTDELQRASRIKMLKQLYPTYNNKQIKALLADLERVEKGAKKPKPVKVTADPKSTGALRRAIDDVKQKKPLAFKADDKAARSTVSNFVSWANQQESSVYVGTRGPGASLVNGGWSGGKVGDIVGFAGGGQVPGTAPSNPRADNVLARDQNGSALRVRSGEWIINERASRLNDRYLRAINSGMDMNKMLPGFAGGGVVGDSGAVTVGPNRVTERVRLEADASGGLYAIITSVAQDVVDGHAATQVSRQRAGAGR